MADYEIAQLLGRTQVAVGIKRRSLGIAKQRPWSSQELRLLKQGFATRTAEEIAQEMDRTPGAIGVRSRMLGLRRCRNEPGLVTRSACFDRDTTKSR